MYDMLNFKDIFVQMHVIVFERFRVAKVIIPKIGSMPSRIEGPYENPLTLDKLLWTCQSNSVLKHELRLPTYKSMKGKCTVKDKRTGVSFQNDPSAISARK